MMVTPGKGNNFQRRAVAGGVSTSSAGSKVTAPYWVRLRRIGDALTAFESPDGVAWTTVGTATVAMPANVLIGLAVSSHLATQAATATFDRVAIIASAVPPPAPEPAPPGVPSPWRTEDVGATGLAGSASFAAATSTWSMAGAGADIWGTADAFRYVYHPLSGDGEIVARVASVQNVAAWVKAGVMIRAELTAGSAHAMMMVTPGKGNAFQRRTVGAGTSSSTPGSFVTAPYWVKLARLGDTITASESADGVTWRTVGSATIPMPGVVFVGLALSSHSATALAAATFDRVSVTAR
jgi:regulation of enolase protein 1 (concanavalin A-like superfamily)